MKKLFFIAAIGVAIYFGLYDRAASFLGFGSARFGMAAKDPLGVPEKLHSVFVTGGFEGELGEVNKPRVISYTLPGTDSSQFKSSGAIVIDVGDEEYVQSIEGVFVGTQHGMSPQRPGGVEMMVSDLWKAVGGPKRPTFESVNEGSFTIPATVKFGRSFSIPIKHMEAQFSSGSVIGKWYYADSTPMEVVELRLK